MFNEEETTPDIELNQQLFAKVAELKMSDENLTYPGYDTPKILYTGQNHGGAQTRFSKDSLNPEKDLMFFSDNPKSAAHYGLTFGTEESPYEGFVESRYILLIFPHESGNLGSWVLETTGEDDKKRKEYITDQDFPLDEAIVVRAGDIMDLPPEQIELSANKNATLETLGISQEQQKELRERIKEYLNNTKTDLKDGG